MSLILSNNNNDNKAGLAAATSPYNRIRYRDNNLCRPTYLRQQTDLWQQASVRQDFHGLQASLQQGAYQLDATQPGSLITGGYYGGPLDAGRTGRVSITDLTGDWMLDIQSRLKQNKVNNRLLLLL